MKRQLCVTVFFALVLVPDWVSACWPPPSGSYYAPVYSYAPAPVYYYAPPPVYCQPVVIYPCTPVAAPAPTIQPPKVERAQPSSSLEAPRPVAQPNPPAPSRAPQIEPVRPAANTEAPKPTDANPTLAPRPDVDKKPETAAPKLPPVEPTGSKIEFPALPDPKAPVVEPKLPPLVLPGEKGEPKLPSLELPKDAGVKLPTLELPKDSDLKLPVLDVPKAGDLKLPALELPKGDAPLKVPETSGAPAVPVPAPAPDALIPPPGVSVPRTAESLPPLTLPPDTPISPSAKSTEVKSSPLTGAVRVSVFPAAGAVVGNGLRKIGFYNHTDRDLSLTIEGRAVKLPAKTYLHAQLPPTFTWKQGERPTAKETVPADASGLDVLFRD